MSEKESEEEKGDGLDVEESEALSERRGDPRHLACFPADLETSEGVNRSALIRDLSVSGALLLTRARMRVGDAVKLSLHLREGIEPVTVSGKVVREEKRPSEMVHPWTKQVAIQFDAPLAELEAEAKALAERQAALRTPPS